MGLNLGGALVGQYFPDLGGPSGGDSSGAAAAEEEARKAALRRKIDRLYGIGTEPVYGDAPETDVLGLHIKGERPVTGQKDNPNDPEALAARQELESEKTKLAEATRSYYTDQLSRAYAKGERGARFNLARRGVLGGSNEVDTMGELATDRNLGATRVDEAVRRAAANLESQREQERLSAIGLVNSGAGDSAVTAAQRGIQNAFANESTAQKADLTSDLFSAGADSFAAQNQEQQAAALAARYRDRLSTFFPPRSTSGRVTASG